MERLYLAGLLGEAQPGARDARRRSDKLTDDRGAATSILCKRDLIDDRALLEDRTAVDADSVAAGRVDVDVGAAALLAGGHGGVFGVV